MTAIFSIDFAQEPQFLDLLGVAAGYGTLSVPVTGLLPGDIVDSLSLTITGTGLSTISATISCCLLASPSPSLPRRDARR